MEERWNAVECGRVAERKPERVMAAKLAESTTTDILTELERRNGFMHKKTTVDLRDVSTLELLGELHARGGFEKGIDIKYVNPGEPFHMQVGEGGAILQRDGVGPVAILIVAV